MSKVRSYLSLIKFSHTIFAMPFALIGFFLPLNEDFEISYGTGQWNLNKTIAWPEDKNEPLVSDSLVSDSLVLKFLLVIGCMIFARNAAMAFNRFLDRNFDAKNPRTAMREVPAGILKENSVLAFTIINCLLFMTCTFFINRLCFYLSPVALTIVLGYSYTKRFTPLCHLILGLGLSLAPIGAYLAVMGEFALLPVLFSLTVIFWVSGFDIIYALQDEEFDKSQRLYSMPSWIGKAKALHVSELFHLVSAICVFFAGWYGGFGWLYWAGAAVFTSMLIYQHTLVKPNDLRKVNLAFMTTNGIASVVFAILVIVDLISRSDFLIFNSYF